MKEKAPLYVNVKVLILLIVTVILVGTILGWTGVFTQTTDWYKHNAVLSDLTDKSWPVYYENGNEESMLTYYLGQYMFPSLIGKMFSSVYVTQAVNGIWAMVGLFIAIIGIFKVTKSDTSQKQLITLIITLLFSTCIALVQNIGKIVAPDLIAGSGHWIAYLNDIKLQLSANPILLRWVMPQVIIPWIMLSFLIDDPYDIKNYMLLFLPVVFYSTLPFIGLVLVLIIFVIIKFIKEKDKIGVIKEIFSLSNICMMCLLGTILIAYFYGNIFLDKPGSVGLSFINYGSNAIIYFMFILTFIPYSIILFKENRRNPFYIISSVMLVLLPFVSMGLYNDFVMRVSIIPLFIYMILCIKMLYNNDVNKTKKIILIIFLIIGSYSSMCEINDCFKLNTNKTINATLENNASREKSNITDDLKYNYYSYDIKENFFYKYLAREDIKK